METNRQMRKGRVAILVDSDFADTEFLVPYNALKQAGAELVVLGSRRHVKYTGRWGETSITSQASTTEAFPDAFEAIIIPGGLAPDSMRTDMKTVRFVQRAAQQGKLLAAIERGPQLLIEANLLRGRRATCFRSIRKDLQNAGAHYLDEQLVADDNLLTARRPGDLPFFVTTLLNRLNLKPANMRLPDEGKLQTEGWQLAEQWGGSSKTLIVEALNSVQMGERYGLAMCERHAQKAADEELKTVFQQLCTDAQQHIQELTARLQDFGAPVQPSAADGASAAQQDWKQLHDKELILLHVLDHLQARIINVYRLCNSLTDPASVDILDRMEVTLAKEEQHLADLYHQKMLVS
ncbi:DJ-1/PfpI/YhbO family deglycase/protease [Ktedonosporobacter rubrisoli]|uniref:DJ-1/PfpI/YhbO family deglycase/protease n=1 Tax=Ktedonosporobacter rubrisoli TaxID=2509675 RepID=A0A4P6JUF2_KTERU|nr:DJ-1/PfpI/YhbO family deglycase/protease [Ktedonosporobacter rubrisoli]QBD78922.1 DJ-1/PfpI/YhbO family deglycase/protease [Ktedonosporobacter rubrisoli]